MNLYEICFIEGVEKKTVYILGNTEAEAGRKFTETFPHVLSTNVISVFIDEPGNKTQVVISDIRMPFMSMVIFMIKAAIAAIPAAAFLWCVSILISGFFMGAIS
ncbi:conserved hypothetical protein [Vibrio coralliirubri]|uniref:hypothetical protein n=1 Tax=Vibrio coralliirubri TaxID=1516159 RepID=UPI000636B564|nr:hypothetical protein [Vibrio coralliirubri]CDT98499.1 conserved hypothetical protein [Vibrio coralliirubri]